MAKFKVGDRVRDIEGAEALIVAVPDDKCIIVEWCGYEGLRGKWPHDGFELVQPNSPIRTVTRREIVPGRYGKVRIDLDGQVSVLYGTHSAEELREAARIFTEIADVLEDRESTQ